MACEVSDIKKLDYEIFNYSSYSANYLPENIREDCPTNPNSRWSSNTNRPPQYLTLKLHRPGILKQIKFGKYEKNHVCNLRKFKILGGLDEEHLMVIFEGGLKNNSLPEIFNLRHKTESGEFLPILYLQIMPLLSWGPSFNFSIWFVELLGQDDPIFIQTSTENCFRKFNMLREVEIVRLCLKHFRLQGYDDAFKALQDQTKVMLEHPKISELHNILVNQGEFDKTELIIEDFVRDGLMDHFLTKQNYKATWELLGDNTSDSKSDCSMASDVDCLESASSSNTNIFEKRMITPSRPGVRGGHQIVVDNTQGLMYLYGGWDGFEDLSDLWLYNMKSKVWTLIQEHSECNDGPSPRSCHKMVFDSVNSQIFTLGRYLDQNSRNRVNIKSDFYLYDTITMTWLQICDDTSQVGGPLPIFDHQMCIDIDKRKIYVFGGRILGPRNSDQLTPEYQYSGLFCYDISSNSWTQLLVDCEHPTASDPNVNSIKSRVTHSMLFHPKYRKLYIFGGQRNKESTKDFISYNVDTNEIEVLNFSASNSSDMVNFPQPGFTQRATLDCDRDEIYVLSSLSKDKERRDININSLWMYSLKSNEWTIIYKNDHTNECHIKNQNMCAEPCPRYAHQLVYDNVNKAHYLFGGNPGKKCTMSHLRLDDFWILYLEKPTREKVLKTCKYLIRRFQYEEITKKNPLEAVKYLQTKLYEIIDRTDSVQLNEFHKLASLLFMGEENLYSTSSSSTLTKPLVNKISSYENIDDDNSTTNVSDITSDMQSEISESISNLDSFTPYSKANFNEQLFQIKNRRCLLFNKLVQFLPENLVQPKENLNDMILY